MRCVWFSVSRVKSRPIAARSMPGRSTPPVSRAVRASRSAATRCAWVSASPMSRRPHSASRPATRWSSAIAARTRSTTNTELPAVAQALDDDGAGVRVEERRDLGVEVRGQPVADVRRHQTLEPVRGRRPGVEGVEGLHERLHGRDRVGAEGARGGRTAARSGRAPTAAIRASSALSAQRREPSGRPAPAARTPRSRRTRSRRAGRRPPPR